MKSKKTVFLILPILLIFLLTTFCTSCNKSHFSLEYGAYGLEKAIITNIITKEVTEKSSEDILNDNEDFKEWGNLLSFQIIINENTEFFYTKNKRCFVLNEGLAYEIIDENTLQLHFPHWNGYDYYSYDIVIILVSQLLYN